MQAMQGRAGWRTCRVVGAWAGGGSRKGGGCWCAHVGEGQQAQDHVDEEERREVLLHARRACSGNHAASPAQLLRRMQKKLDTWTLSLPPPTGQAPGAWLTCCDMQGLTHGPLLFPNPGAYSLRSSSVATCKATRRDPPFSHPLLGQAHAWQGTTRTRCAVQKGPCVLCGRHAWNLPFFLALLATLLWLSSGDTHA